MPSTFSTKIPTNQLPAIPDYLIAEEIDGIPFYYKGYKSVVKKEAELSNIKSSSVLKSVILQHIIRAIILFDAEEEQFLIGTNKAGLYIDQQTNIINDLALYDNNKMTANKIIGKYADFPPEIVIEVDIDVESLIMSPLDGAYLKTKRMLTFGVKKVIWIFTSSQKILIALPNQSWETVDWDKDIEIVKGLTINVANYLKKRGVLKEEQE